MSVTPDQGRRALRERRRREDARQVPRARRGRELAAELARRCVAHGARRVVLFGSLVTGDFGRIDIDLAVEGLPSDVYVELLGQLLLDAPGFSVDLVRVETAPPSLAERIASEGQVLLET